MGKIASSSGLAASPGFSFKDEPNTGLFTEGAGVLGYAVDGTEVMSVSGTTLAFKANAGMTENLPSNTSEPSSVIQGRMYWNPGDSKLKIYASSGDELVWQSMTSGFGTSGTLAKFSASGTLVDSGISITNDDIIFGRRVLAISASAYQSAFLYQSGGKVLVYYNAELASEFTVGGDRSGSDKPLRFYWKEADARAIEVSKASSAEGTGGYPSFSLAGNSGVFKSLSLRFGSSGAYRIETADSKIIFVCDTSSVLDFGSDSCYAYQDTTVCTSDSFSLRCREIVTSNLSFYGGGNLNLNFTGDDTVNFHIEDGETDSVFKYEGGRAKAVLNSSTKVNCDTTIGNKISLSDEGIRAYVPLSTTDYTCYKRDGDYSGFWSSSDIWLLRINNSGDVYINKVETENTVYLECNDPAGVYISSPSFTGLGSNTGDDLAWVESTGKVVKASSSRRYKKDIVDLEFDPFKVLELKPTFYTRIDSGRREFGLIAEEVYQVLPQLVVCKHDTGEPEAVKHELLNVLYVSVLKSFDSRFERIEKAFVFRDGAVPFDPSAHMADLRDLQVRQGEIHGRLDVLSDKADEMETALGKLEELVSRN